MDPHNHDVIRTAAAETPQARIRRFSRTAGSNVDLGGDCAVVSWRDARTPEAEAWAGPAEPPPGRAELLVDGDPLDRLPIEAGGRLAERRGPGEARSVTYPVPREARSLAVVIALPSGARSEPLPVRLP